MILIILWWTLWTDSYDRTEGKETVGNKWFNSVY